MKTLKDLSNHWAEGDSWFADVHKEDLREEAKKWVKRFNERDFEIEGGLFSWEKGKKRNSTFEERAVLIGWIKQFFNLSEEEEKE